MDGMQALAADLTKRLDCARLDIAHAMTRMDDMARAAKQKELQVCSRCAKPIGMPGTYPQLYSLSLQQVGIICAS